MDYKVPVIVLTATIALLVAYIIWRRTPTLHLVHQFESARDMPPVVGVTSLLGHIYVIREPANDVKVYNATSFELITMFYVSNLVSVADMTSNSHHREIYIADNRKNKVFCLQEPAAHKARLRRARFWSIGCKPTGLSVSPESNIVVACLGTRYIKQFTQYGHLLSSHSETDVHPFHAISLPDRQIVIGSSDDNVCAKYVPDKKLSIKYVELDPPPVIWLFGATMTSSTPMTHVVDCHIPVPPRSVIVVDDYLLYNDNTNHCLQMLDLSTLAKLGQLRRPPNYRIHRLWYDEETRRLFAVDGRGRINVFHVSKR